MRHSSSYYYRKLTIMRIISNECLCIGQKFLFSNTFWLSIWIFSCFGSNVIGTILLSPMSVAPVCRLGDPLQLTCTTSVEFIRWSIVVTNEQGMEEEITVSRNSREISPPPRERIVNSTKFTFTRVSAEGDLPLISTLAINSTGIDLNGTVVCCVDANNPMTESASTSIHIINIINSKCTHELQLQSL